MISEKTFTGFVRGSAWYDLVVTAPFATPWTLAALFSVMGWAHSTLELSGQLPQLSTDTVLFANLMGSVILVWSVARLMVPLALFGRLDAVGRGLFACWQIFAMVNGGTMFIAVFTAMEVFWGILQLLPHDGCAISRQLRSASRCGPG